MNSFRPGVTNCSSQIEGCTPVIQWSNPISFASCQFGVTSVISCASSSKQNKKNKWGYQCRKKCHHCPAIDSPSARQRSAERACCQQINSTTHTTIARTPSNRAGCRKCSANKAINTLDTPKYANAARSNAPHATHAAAASLRSKPGAGALNCC